MPVIRDRRTGEVIWETAPAHLRRINLNLKFKINLRSADLSGIDLRESILAGLDLSDANLEDARIEGAKYDRFTKWPEGFDPETRGASLVPPQLRGADRRGEDLRGIDWSDADLHGANLSDADLSGARLDRAILIGANLKGSNFSGASLSDADLHSAKWDERTIWPQGFDPKPFKAEENPRSSANRELDALASFMKALSDKNRLRILGILSGEERTVEELAAALHLQEPTVSHHLKRLKEEDLIRMRQEGTSHLYGLIEERLSRRLAELSPDSIRRLAGDVNPKSYDAKVLKTFFEDERLIKIPLQRKKFLVILRRLVEEFKPGVRYTEKEASEILKRFHEDYALLRRALVDEKLMTREHGIYWRLPDQG